MMKKINLALLAIAVTINFIACDNRNESGVTDAHNSDFSKNETDSTRGDKPADSSSLTSTTPPSQESIDFVMKAASGGMMEVQAGQLAQQNAKKPACKRFWQHDGNRSQQGK